MARAGFQPLEKTGGISREAGQDSPILSELSTVFSGFFPPLFYLNYLDFSPVLHLTPNPKPDPKPQTSNSTHQTPNRKPQTLNSALQAWPQTLNPKSQTPNLTPNPKMKISTEDLK